MSANLYNQRLKKLNFLIFDNVYSRWRKLPSIIPRPECFHKKYAVGRLHHPKSFVPSSLVHLRTLFPIQLATVILCCCFPQGRPETELSGRLGEKLQSQTVVSCRRPPVSSGVIFAVYSAELWTQSLSHFFIFSARPECSWVASVWLETCRCPVAPWLYWDTRTLSAWTVVVVVASQSRVEVASRIKDFMVLSKVAQTVLLGYQQRNGEQ